MADINQSVEISYTADISDLLKQIEKLPGASKEEAQKLTKEITKSLRETEKASKKAAATNSKSMQRMGNDAKKATRHFRQMKREASEIGRGLVDLAVIFGDTESPMGEFVNKLGMFGIVAGSLFPIFQHLRTVIVRLGASTAIATGGLSVLAGAAAYFVATMGETDEAAQKQAKALEQLNKKYKKFRDELEKSIEENEKFKETVQETFNAIQNAGRDFEQQKYELQFELGQIGAKEFRQLIQGAKIAETYQDIQDNFDKREKALTQQLTNETQLAQDAIMNLYNAANRLDIPISIRATEQIAHYAALEATDAELQATIKNLYPSLNKQLETQMFLVAKRAQQERIARDELNEFTKKRTKEQDKQEEQALEILDLEEKLWWQSQKTNEAKEKTSAIAEAYIAKQERLLSIEEKISASIENQRKTRLSLLDEDLKRSQSLAEFEDIITEKHKLQTIELLNQNLEKQKQIGLNILQAGSAEELLSTLELNTEIMKEMALIDEQRTNLTLSNMAKIAAEEEKINQLRLQGSNAIFQNAKNLFDMQFTSAKNNFEDEKNYHDKRMDMEEKKAEAEGRFFLAKKFTETEAGKISAQAADRAFRIQQSLAIAQIAIDAASGAVKALATYGPVLGPIVAGTIAATAAAQTGVVLGQQPPSASAHMGQPMAPDEQTIRVLSGEAVLDRRTVQSLGGEQGIRSMQQGTVPGAEVIVLNTFKHFDKYNKSARRQMGSQKRGSGGY